MSENSFNIIALGKCEVPYTKSQYSLKQKTPGRGILGHRAIVYTNLVEVHWVMLQTKYPGSMPIGSRQNIFIFSLYKPLQYM